jgi:hypothetical protein
MYGWDAAMERRFNYYQLGVPSFQIHIMPIGLIRRWISQKKVPM